MQFLLEWGSRILTLLGEYGRKESILWKKDVHFIRQMQDFKELRQEISNYLDRKIHVRYDYVHEVMVTVGGSEGIDLTMRAMLNPGDEVLVPEPSYVSYAPCVTLADGVPVPIPMKEENEFKLTAEELEVAITPKTKILVLPFPNNPTGAIMTKEEPGTDCQTCREI